MTERRVVHNSLKLTEERQTIAAGEIVLARATRDYQDDIVASRIELWIETEIMMPSDDPQPGEPTVPWPAGTSEVLVLGTAQPLAAEAVWLVSVDDHPAAWHVYRVAPEQWAVEIHRDLGRHRRQVCGATPATFHPSHITDPAERPYWRVVCQEDPTHDPTNPHTPHRAGGLGSHGLGEFAWGEEP